MLILFIQAPVLDVQWLDNAFRHHWCIPGISGVCSLPRNKVGGLPLEGHFMINGHCFMAHMQKAR
jgi:hypothetical protein